MLEGTRRQESLKECICELSLALLDKDGVRKSALFAIIFDVLDPLGIFVTHCSIVIINFIIKQKGTCFLFILIYNEANVDIARFFFIEKN